MPSPVSSTLASTRSPFHAAIVTRPPGRVSQGVVGEVQEDLDQPVAVAEHRRQGGGHVHRELDLPGRRALGLGLRHLLQHARQGHRREGAEEVAALDEREVEDLPASRARRSVWATMRGR